MTNSNAARFAVALAALAALTGCGGGSSYSPPPAPAPAPAPAPTPVSASAFTPADGSTKIGVHAPISIAFDGALDPASVTSAHVKLVGNGTTLRPALAYDDATHTITVTPALESVTYGAHYTLSITGLVGANGLPIADAQATFATWGNGFLQADSLGGLQPSRDVYTYDASGRVLRIVSYDLADLTSIVGDREFTYSADGLAVTTKTMAAGTDGVWLTGDDTVTYTTIDTYDAQGRQLTREEDPGQPFGALTTYTYDADGYLTQSLTVQSGADGVYGTSDDQQWGGIAYSYDAQGRWSTISQSNGAGADGVQFTDDDVNDYQAYSWAADGLSMRYDDYNAAGADGKFATVADDQLAYYGLLTYDAHGNRIRSVTYTAASPGGPMVVHRYMTYTYDANDNRKTLTSFSGPGPDGTWFTADDVVSNVYTFDTAN